MLYITSEGEISHVFGNDGLFARHRCKNILHVLCPHSCVGKKCILNWKCMRRDELFEKYLAETNSRTGL